MVCNRRFKKLSTIFEKSAEVVRPATCLNFPSEETISVYYQVVRNGRW